MNAAGTPDADQLSKTRFGQSELHGLGIELPPETTRRRRPEGVRISVDLVVDERDPSARDHIAPAESPSSRTSRLIRANFARSCTKPLMPLTLPASSRAHVQSMPSGSKRCRRAHSSSDTPEACRTSSGAGSTLDCCTRGAPPESVRARRRWRATKSPLGIDVFGRSLVGKTTRVVEKMLDVDLLGRPSPRRNVLRDGRVERQCSLVIHELSNDEAHDGLRDAHHQKGAECLPPLQPAPRRRTRPRTTSSALDRPRRSRSRATARRHRCIGERIPAISRVVGAPRTGAGNKTNLAGLAGCGATSHARSSSSLRGRGTASPRAQRAEVGGVMAAVRTRCMTNASALPAFVCSIARLGSSREVHAPLPGVPSAPFRRGGHLVRFRGSSARSGAARRTIEAHRSRPALLRPIVQPGRIMCSFTSDSQLSDLRVRGQALMGWREGRPVLHIGLDARIIARESAWADGSAVARKGARFGALICCAAGLAACGGGNSGDRRPAARRPRHPRARPRRRPRHPR